MAAVREGGRDVPQVFGAPMFTLVRAAMAETQHGCWSCGRKGNLGRHMAEAIAPP